MADWTNLPDQIPGAAALATWANAVRDNPVAIAQGAPGAPRLQSGAYGTNSIPFTALGPSSVRRAHVHTVVQQAARSGPGITHFTFAGGEWMFWPALNLPGAGENNVAPAFARPGLGGDNSSGPRLTLQKEGLGATGTQLATFRYLPGSPPYDLGDGEVAGFAYATVAPDGTIVSLWLAPDPPWCGLKATDEPMAEFRAGRLTRQQMIERYRALADAPEDKLAGMKRRPHPVLGETPAATVVLLDPMSPIITDLLAVIEGGGCAAELFECGALKLDNQALRRRTPPGVPAHAVMWR